MNKYVVAYCSLHDGELTQEVVEAESAVDAAKYYLNWGAPAFTDNMTMEELEEVVYDSDGYISVLDITPKYVPGIRGGSGFKTETPIPAIQ